MRGASSEWWPWGIQLPGCRWRRGGAGKQGPISFECSPRLALSLHPHRHQALCPSKRAQFHLLPRVCREGPRPGRRSTGAGPGGGGGEGPGTHPENLPADVGDTVLLQGVPFRVLHQVCHRTSTTELHHQLWSQGGTGRKSICQARPPSPARPLEEDWSPWGQNWYELESRGRETPHKGYRTC